MKRVMQCQLSIDIWYRTRFWVHGNFVLLLSDGRLVLRSVFVLYCITIMRTIIHSILKVQFNYLNRGQLWPNKSTFYSVPCLLCFYESPDIQTLQWNPGKIQTSPCVREFCVSKHLLTNISFYSEPLFTRQNPFTSSSRLGKTHYHPSRTQSLSKTEKKTVCCDLDWTCTF